MSGGITHRVIAAALLLALAMPAGALAQSPDPVEVDASEVLYQADAQTQVLSDEDWCSYFTQGGWLMPIDVCVAQVQALLGDPDARSVPQALVPEDPAPPGKVFTMKGKGTRETKSFRLASGTYKVSLTHQHCDRAPNAFLMPVGQQALVVPRTLTSGSVIHDLEAGKYALEVFGLPKDGARKPCTWRIRLTPDPG